MAPLSEEEENYIRLALLLKGVSPRAVRSYFDREFPPTLLPSKLNTNSNTLYDLKFSRVLNQSQWNLLFPRHGVPDSETFDVTLMICLIRNLTSTSQPINGFDSLPLPGETTPGADLARIKWYRNKLAHHESNKIDNVYFRTAWSDMSAALSRLGDQPMNQECQDLKIKILDKSNQEIMLEIKQSQIETIELRQTVDILGTEHSEVTKILRNLQDSNSSLQTVNLEVTEHLSRLHDSYSSLQSEHSNVKDSMGELQTKHSEVTEHLRKLQDSHRTLQTEHTDATGNLRRLQDSHTTLQTEHSEVIKMLKNPIPLNIRGQIKEELDAWKEDDQMFVETRGANSVLTCIKENECVVVTGSSGTGKTSLVRHVALKMQKEGYDILPISNPKHIIKWYYPSKKIIFVVDDFCGTYSMNPMQFENWKILMSRIKTLIEKKPVKLIMSCRLQVYKEGKMKSLSFFQSCECNLLSANFCLSRSEKQCLAELYLKTNASKIDELYDTFDCFPLLCHLCSKNTKLSITDFFKNPYTVYKHEIEKLQIEGANVKYCALALCVMFNNRLKEEWLTEDIDKDITTVINNTFEACKVVKGTSRMVLRDDLDSLSQTFIRKDGGWYRTIHDKLFDFLAFYFGSTMIHCLINNASSSFIRSRFLFEKEFNSDDYMIRVPNKYQNMYINRLLEDWSKGNVQNVFCNINMDNQFFRQRFVIHIQGLEISQQKQLASLYDTHTNTTPLIQCCYIGYIDMVTWCLRHCIGNINHCRKRYGIAPVTLVTLQDIPTEFCQMLIENIEKFIDCGASALYVACQNGQTEVVRMLISNKADINSYIDFGVLPLGIACGNGHAEIVHMLINNKAEVNKCSYREISPLFIACQNGYIEIVLMLISKKADINKCIDTGSSPLYIACQNGHTEVVQILINDKADINKCRDTGHSPLFIACQDGYAEIVQMLINDKACINKCTDSGASPLYIACQNGHTEVVQMLMNNKADINKCKANGESPLLIACHKGHTVVVQMLINHDANINKCNDKGVSPLFNACQEGHVEVVQMLINNKADIDKCNAIEVSPLFISCYRGHSEIVQMLINNKADINKCDDEKVSPLSIACQKGHTKIVQMLINNEADINKCDYKELSPLYIACQEGHIEVVHILVSNKADINKRLNTGESPLSMACVKGYTQLVELLIKNHADCNIKFMGLTLLDIARFENRTKMVQLLQTQNKYTVIYSRT